MMGKKNILHQLKIRWIVVFTMLSACVDPISFPVPDADKILVVDGMISDRPGPYSVTLSTTTGLNTNYSLRSPVTGASIILYDDTGATENLIETTKGVYQTAGLIQGRVGHAYFITIQTADEKTYESIPETIFPSGTLEKIRFEFEEKTILAGDGELNADRFNLLVDADGASNESGFFRWRFKGTYKVQTFPELHYFITPDGFRVPDPLPCSGYIYNGILERVGDCTCCECWISLKETTPVVSDNKYVVNNQYRSIPVGQVPVNVRTFFDKVYVEVDQMSLTENAYTFLKLVRAQKEGASSLFQPIFGSLKGNVVPTNSSDKVIGLFWASAVQTQSIYLQKPDVPYIIQPIDTVRDSCLELVNATTVKPGFWQ